MSTVTQTVRPDGMVLVRYEAGTVTGVRVALERVEHPSGAGLSDPFTSQEAIEQYLRPTLFMKEP